MAKNVNKAASSPSKWQLFVASHRDAIIAAWKKNPLPGDGHTIFEPSFYIEKGYPADFVQNYVKLHKSDGTPKGTISNNRGEALLHLEGVYNLDILSAIAAVVQAEYEGKFGRGSQAQAIVNGINRKLCIPRSA